MNWQRLVRLEVALALALGVVLIGAAEAGAATRLDPPDLQVVTCTVLQDCRDQVPDQDGEIVSIKAGALNGYSVYWRVAWAVDSVAWYDETGDVQAEAAGEWVTGSRTDIPTGQYVMVYLASGAPGSDGSALLVYDRSENGDAWNSDNYGDYGMFAAKSAGPEEGWTYAAWSVAGDELGSPFDVGPLVASVTGAIEGAVVDALPVLALLIAAFLTVKVIRRTVRA